MEYFDETNREETTSLAHISSELVDLDCSALVALNNPCDRIKAFQMRLAGLDVITTDGSFNFQAMDRYQNCPILLSLHGTTSHSFDQMQSTSITLIFAL